MFKMLLARAHEARARELEGESGLEGGFTLIELMVVLLIMAILLAIAIPTFLGVSGSARDRSAQSNATNALTDMISYYQTGQTYDAASTSSGSDTACSQKSASCTVADTTNTQTYSALQSLEPAFTWQAGASACNATNYSKCVSVQPVDVVSSNDGQGVILAVLSGNNNNCWFVANLQTGNSSNPVQVVATTGFETASTNPGSESGATTAGTYYAELPASISSGTSSCDAAEPAAWTSSGKTWTWYSSYSAASAASIP